MIRRLPLLLLLWADSAPAWVAGGPTSPTGWVTYVAGVAERSAAVRQYHWSPGGSSPPSNYVQSVRLHLGLVATNAEVTWATNRVGPVICDTSVVAGVTNVTCWTNHASLDTDYLRDTYIERIWGGDPDPTSGPYGAQIATNLVWTNTDSRLSGYTLPGSLTVTPTRALLMRIDDDLAGLLPKYYDIREMRRVAGSNVAGVALIDAYLSTPIGTNWLWTGGQSGTGNVWYATNAYPSGLPFLTLSNAWRWAGIPVVRHVASVTTNVRYRYGWEAGLSGSYLAGTLTNIVTNWAEEYRYENSPMQRAWSVLLRQVAILATASVDRVYTNVSPDGITSTVAVTTKQLGLVDIRQEDIVAIMGHDVAFVVAHRHATNTLALYPPGTGAMWHAAYEPLVLAVAGSAAVTSNGVHNSGAALTVLVHSADAIWTNGRALLNIGSPLAAAFPGSTGYFWAVQTLSSTNAPLWVELWTNGIPPTNSVLGTTIELHAKGSYFASAAPSVGYVEYAANDLAQRLRVLEQLQWTPYYAPMWTTQEVFAFVWDGWHGSNYTAYAHHSCERSTWSDSLTNSCGDFPSIGDFVVSPYTPPPVAMRTNSLVFRFELQAFYDVWRQSQAGAFVETRGAQYSPEITWPDVTAITGMLHDALLAADVDAVGRVAIAVDTPSPYRYPYAPATNEHTRAKRLDCTEWAFVTNRVVVGGDAFGPDQLYSKVWQSGSKGAGGRGFQIVGVDFADGLRPDPEMVTSDTISYSTTCDADGPDGDGTPFTEYREWTVFYPKTTLRELKDFALVFRWNFQHCPRPQDQ